MTRLFTVDHSGVRPNRPDLDSAYNDGFEPSPRPKCASTWMVIVWSFVAWCIGSFVLLEAAANALEVAWAHIKRWMS